MITNNNLFFTDIILLISEKNLTISEDVLINSDTIFRGINRKEKSQ